MGGPIAHVSSAKAAYWYLSTQVAVPILRTGTCGRLLMFEALGDIWVVLEDTGILTRGNLRCHVANPSMVCLEIS